MASLTTFSLLPSSSLPISRGLPVAPFSLSSSTVRISPPAALPIAASPFKITDPVGAGDDFPVDYAHNIPKVDASDRRRFGILLHPTSLPGPHGIGDLGEEALRFIDWLHSAGCSVWQVLPLVPLGRRANEEGSPCSGQDANCGNTLLISLDELVKDGLLDADELPKPIDADRVNFDTVAELKDPLVAKAAERLVKSERELKNDLQNIRRDPCISSWLEDAAYFAAIDSICNTVSWYEWPEPLKNCHLPALEKIYQSKKDFIDIFVAQQFLFQRQWQKIRNYAQLKGIKIMGNMPIYVGYHSADVWTNKKQFLLNRKGFPLLVSGVPPDALSETGQLWDSPLYDRKAMERDGYCGWTRRIQRAMDLYHEFRIAHFRGFAGFWAVQSEAKIATVGRWKAGPGKLLFAAIFKAVGNIDIIAEDLGVITQDVGQLRKSIGAPGMAVLQFGFGSDAENPHLPHNHEKNQVVFTGTHDNDTAGLNQEEKNDVLSYLSLSKDGDISWELIRTALSSVAKTAIVPMQDILGLGSSARLNIPATQFGNWSWRIPASVTFEGMDTEARKLRDLLSMYGRL